MPTRSTSFEVVIFWEFGLTNSHSPAQVVDVLSARGMSVLSPKGAKLGSPGREPRDRRPAHVVDVLSARGMSALSPKGAKLEVHGVMEVRGVRLGFWFFLTIKPKPKSDPNGTWIS